MSSLKVTYFDAPGRAEPVRLAFAIAGIKFEDERLSGPEFGAMKPKLPVGSVPVLTVDGAVYAQSAAMLRYAGKRSNLYPTDDLAAMRVDEVMDTVEEVITRVFMDSSAEARKKLVDEVVPRYFSRLDQIAADNKGSSWFVGNSMTVADIKCYTFVQTLKAGVLENIPANVVDKYTHVLQVCKAVGETPKIAEWEKAHQPKA